MKDFVFGLFDDDVEPNAEISRHDVHQTEISDGSGFTINRHLYTIEINSGCNNIVINPKIQKDLSVQKNEIHLNESKNHSGGRGDGH